MNHLSTLFILAFSSLSLTTTITTASTPVKDWKGDEVEAGVLYDLWGVGKDRGPIGIGQSLDPSHCILSVIGRRNRWPEPYLPDPVIFKAANTTETLVRVGEDYNIIFGRQAGEDSCNVWMVNLELGSDNHNFITTGGRSGHPGCRNFNTWFRLVLANEAEHLYKLIFNPPVCNEKANCAEEITFASIGEEDRLYLNQRQYLQRLPILVRFARHTTKIREAWE